MESHNNRLKSIEYKIRSEIEYLQKLNFYAAGEMEYAKHRTLNLHRLLDAWELEASLSAFYYREE